MCKTANTMPLVEFEQKHMAEFQRLAALKTRLDDLKTQEQEVRESLIHLMEENGITKIDNDIMTITYVGPSESVSIDTKAFRAEDPSLYDDVLQRFNKRSKRSASIRFKVK